MEKSHNNKMQAKKCFLSVFSVLEIVIMSTKVL